MSITDLPTETLLRIIQYALRDSGSKRQLLLELALVCKDFSAVCLPILYSKVAYQMSPAQASLLRSLQQRKRPARNLPSYAELVRTLTIKEDKGGSRLGVANSRVGKQTLEDAAERQSHRYQRDEEETSGNAYEDSDSDGDAYGDPYYDQGPQELDAFSRSRIQGFIRTAIRKEEDIAKLLQAVGPTLRDLKYQTNLLPPLGSAPSFATLINLQRLAIDSQEPYFEDATDYEIRQQALFALPLPRDIFLTAFSASWQHLRYLNLSRCSFDQFFDEGNGPSETSGPVFHLETLILKECAFPYKSLPWLVKSSIEAQSLKTVRLDMCKAKARDTRAFLLESGPNLDSLAVYCDGHEASLDDDTHGFDYLDEPDYDKWTWKPCFKTLRTLKRLELGGEGITSQHFNSIPQSVFASVTSLVLDYTSSLSPGAVTKVLRAVPEGSPLKAVILKGKESAHRKQYREIVFPHTLLTDYTWRWKTDVYTTLAKAMKRRGVAFSSQGRMMKERSAKEKLTESDGSEDEFGV